VHCSIGHPDEGVGVTARGGVTGRRTAGLEGLSAISGDAATAQTRAEDSAGRAGGPGAEGGAGTARELTGDEGGRRERELGVTTLTRRGEDGDSRRPQHHCTKERDQHALGCDDDPQCWQGPARSQAGEEPAHVTTTTVLLDSSATFRLVSFNFFLWKQLKKAAA
jgi:hypothetical protein